MPTSAILLIFVSALMHAGWNLLVHSHRQDRYALLRITLVFGLIGIIPVLVAEWTHPVLTTTAWAMLGLTTVSQSMYLVGLTMGYRCGDFTVVYPLVRAMPIFFLGVVDIVRNQLPTPTGWVGIAMVVLGCFALGAHAMRRSAHMKWSMLWFWMVLAAAGTVGYTTVDKFGIESMSGGFDPAIRYAVIEFLCGAVGGSLCLGLSPVRILCMPDRSGWRVILFGATLLGMAYVLILWAYHLVDQVSYVAAGRQVSIAIGVVLAARLLHERVSGVRIGLAVMIAMGVILIGMA